MIGHARMIAGKTWILQNDVTECYGGFEALRAFEHEEIDLLGGIARIPVDILGHVAMAEVPAFVVPIGGIAVVTAGVMTIDGGLRETIGPYFRDAVSRLYPAAKAAYILERRLGLRPVRETDDLDLHGGIAIGLDAARRVSQRPRRFAGIDVLEDRRRIDREMRIRSVVSECVEGSLCSTAFSRVMDDLEWATCV